jgi:hypothetical protein
MEFTPERGRLVQKMFDVALKDKISRTGPGSFRRLSDDLT